MSDTDAEDDGEDHDDYGADDDDDDDDGDADDMMTMMKVMTYPIFAGNVFPTTPPPYALPPNRHIPRITRARDTSRR